MPSCRYTSRRRNSAIAACSRKLSANWIIGGSSDRSVSNSES